ncbi:hypothetical protein BH10PSE19_BH10PSE19_03100 [soil metagenome]
MRVIILFLLCFSLITKAETNLTCPSITSIRTLKNIWPHGRWLPLYRDNDELASENDIKKFSEEAQHLLTAQWSGNFLEMAHCVYEGGRRILLARNMLKPDYIAYPRWKLILPSKIAICVSSNEDDCVYGGMG